MYYGKKKKILIAIIIIVVLILAIAGGLYLVLATDLFQSNETMFYKYLGEEAQKIQYDENTRLLDIEKAKESKPYITEGELTVSYDGENAELTEQITNILDNIKITANGKFDKANKLENQEFKVLYGTQNLFEVQLARTDEIYALKSDEIVNAYVGIRNSDIPTLLEKLGITVGQEMEIPNKIQSTSQSISRMTEEELKHIKDTYLPVIQNNLSKEKYTKQSGMTVQKNGTTYETTAYRLDLNQEDILNITTKVLETLKEDSITLNYIATQAKGLGLNEQYANVNNINDVIDELLKNIDTKEFKDGMSIVLYEKDGEILSTEIIVKNKLKITMQYTKNKTNEILNIKMENLSTDGDFSKAEINIMYTQTSEMTLAEVEISVDEKLKINISEENIGTVESDSIDSTLKIAVTTEGQTVTINYTGKMEFIETVENMVALDNTNCAILNDYDKETVQSFLTAIMQRTLEVFTEKMTLVTTSAIGNNVQDMQQDPNITINQ